jgi:hypothetical protein
MKKIDTTFFRPLSDIDFDGSNDTLYYHLQAQTWRQPFVATIEVRNKTKTIYSTTRTENVVDDAFKGDVAIDFCEQEGYLPCKEKWYYEIVMDKFTILVGLKDDRRAYLFDTLNDMAIPKTLEKMYMDSLHLNQQKAIVAVKRVLNLYKKNSLTFFIMPPHPVYPSFPSIFDPISKKMVMIMGF